jgi:hypothetical protein
MSGIDLAIDNLKAQVAELKQQFSQARKRGLDVSLPYLKFMNLPSKVGLAEATKSLQDIKQVSMMIEEVRGELDAAEKQEKIKAKAHDGKNYVQRMDMLFTEAAKELRERNLAHVLKIYAEIRGLYPFVPEELKKGTYQRCMELYNSLLAAKKEA